jgi:hypothetical protein
MPGVSASGAGHARVRFDLVPPPPDADVPILYANFVQASVTPNDLTMDLGWYGVPALTEQPTQPVRVQVRGLAKLTVPLNLVPGIINVLQSQLDAWQRTFGEAEALEDAAPVRTADDAT